MEYFLEPNEFFVGDHVQFFFCLPENFVCKDYSLDKIKQKNSLTITDIKITKINGKDYIKIDFIPWMIGEINFPSFEEIGIHFDFPSIFVSSVLEIDKSITFQEARPPLLLPGTIYLIYGYIFTLLISCFLITFIIIWLKKRKNSIIKRLSQRYAIFLFHRSLKRLKKREKISETKKEWTKKYENSLRLFLSSIYKNNKNWNSFTYKEILEAIDESNDETIKLVKLIFDNLSLIRFANMNNDAIEKKILDYSFRLLASYNRKN
ncbi:MAG: hypothetical protein ACTTKH_04565 [Treponema sp.]